MAWKVCMQGEWCGPFTLKRIDELTAGRPSRFLFAEGTTQEEFAEVAKLARVGGLAILSRDINAAATGILAQLTELRELLLCGPPITDEFLAGLESLAQLQSITLVHTACTPAGVRRLLDHLPQGAVYKAGLDDFLPASLRLHLHPFLPDATTQADDLSSQ